MESQSSTFESCFRLFTLFRCSFCLPLAEGPPIQTICIEFFDPLSAREKMLLVSLREREERRIMTHVDL